MFFSMYFRGSFVAQNGFVAQKPEVSVTLSIGVSYWNIGYHRMDIFSGKMIPSDMQKRAAKIAP